MSGVTTCTENSLKKLKNIIVVVVVIIIIIIIIIIILQYFQFNKRGVLRKKKNEIKKESKKIKNG
uniref:Uncharacterized protein n=1 Tax=Octopus bimaculoides TaxID=37653 RepID=A0A0L8FT81_OCTBM